MYIDSLRHIIYDAKDLDDEIKRIQKIVGHPITIFYHHEENKAVMLYFDKAIYIGREVSKSYNQVDYAWWYKLEEMDR